MATKPILLSGDNPQIPMGFGEAPVAAFLDAVPATGPGGWKHAACRRIDAIVSREVPGVSKAVKWNSPFYGAQQACWFLSFHCYHKHVKVRWHNGKRLSPLPPIDSRHPLLRHRRNRPVRFAGAWSVRLTGEGYHVSHNHPQGWISSAFYVALPESIPDRTGWLRLGVPQAELGIDLPAFRWIEPQVGRLVLFPSTMWHGTLPFPAGERMTVAFDVAPPRN